MFSLCINLQDKTVYFLAEISRFSVVIFLVNTETLNCYTLKQQTIYSYTYNYVSLLNFSFIY